MSATLAERIFSRVAGASVRGGQLVEVSPDWMFTIDDTIGTLLSYMKRYGIEHPAAPERIILFYDHYAPADTAGHAAEQAMGRVFCREAGLGGLHDVGVGISHQVAVEKGIVRPGQLALNTDSHTTTLGAAACLGIGVGAAEMAYLWATGRLWFRVPESMRIVLAGTLRPGVYAKDLMLALVGRLGPLGALYRSVEFHGEAIARLVMAERMTLCNMAAELGAKCAVIPADAVTRAHFRQLGVDYDEESGRPGTGARYAEEITLALEELEPMVAGPHRADRVAPVRDLVQVPIHQAFLGTCTNGRLEDLRAAAAVLRDRHIATGVRMIVTPASREVYAAALAEGLISTFISAGCVVTTPGCGPCAGLHMGLVGDGETCIASSSRNFRGRMGSTKAEVYLGSPATVAASAVTGAISDPREFVS